MVSSLLYRGYTVTHIHAMSISILFCASTALGHGIRSVYVGGGGSETRVYYNMYITHAAVRLPCNRSGVTADAYD